MTSIHTLILACCGCLLLLDCCLEVEACSCQPTHPQNLFCRSDFVIKVRVKRAKFVELRPNGKFKVINPKSEEEKGEKKMQDGELERVEISKESDEEQPAPHYAGPPGLGARIADHSATRMHLRLDRAGPPGYSASNGQNRKKRSPVIIPLSSYQPSGIRGPPGSAQGSAATPQSRVMMQYKVDIAKIYKGLQNFSEEQLKFIYTPPVPLCNAKLPTDRSPIILMGDLHEGRLLVRQCDYKVGLSKLDIEQRKNLVRNVERRYPTHCEQCHVEVCNLGTCTGEQQPHQCRWKEWWSANSPYSSQFVCVRGKRSKCKWYNALSKDIDPEDIDEWTR